MKTEIKRKKMKKLILLVALLGLGVGAYSQELCTSVTDVETYDSGWTYIDYKITNPTDKTGWIYITIVWVDDQGNEQKESGTLTIAANGYSTERLGVQNYGCCARVDVWFKD